MAASGNGKEEDLSRLLTDAIEVQLAALKAGIGFWSEWIERTTEFVQSATRTLAEISAEEQEAKEVLLELVDAGRASVRGMTEIPRNTATRFIEELDRLKEESAKARAELEKKAAKKKTTKKKKATKKAAAKKKASASKKAASKKTASKKTAGKRSTGKRKRVARAKS